LALVEQPVVGAADALLLAEMERAGWTGIDARFGWPESLVYAVGQYAESKQWPYRGAGCATGRWTSSVATGETPRPDIGSAAPCNVRAGSTCHEPESLGRLAAGAV